jgi:ParB/RepB/Spo0J family partition protein
MRQSIQPGVVTQQKSVVICVYENQRCFMADEQIQYFPLEQIAENRQPREQFDEEALLGLAQSLRELGQLQPIRVRRIDNQLTVVDGARRLRAAKMAGMKMLAVILEEKELCNAEVLHRQLVANCQREDFSPVEKAKAVAQLMEQACWSATQAAAHLGFSNATVTRLLALNSVPSEIQKRVTSGEISASAAYSLAGVADPMEQARLADHVAGGRLTRDALVGQLRTQRRRSAEPSTSTCPSRVTAVLGAGRSITLSGSGITMDSLIQWLEELTAKARKIRPQGIEITTFIKMLRDQAKA